MGIEVHITDDDYLAVINNQNREIAMLRIQLESAKRTIRELDLSTPEGASRLIGIATLEEDSDEDELPGVPDAN
jgi:hypothetical protein